MVKFQWKNHLKTVDFAKFSMKKDIAGLFNLRGGVAGFSKMCVRGCEAGFFLKKWCGRDPAPRAALVQMIEWCFPINRCLYIVLDDAWEGFMIHGFRLLWILGRLLQGVSLYRHQRVDQSVRCASRTMHYSTKKFSPAALVFYST